MMIPAYILEELKKRERERKTPAHERPMLEIHSWIPADREAEKASEKPSRGVEIINILGD